MQTYTTFKLQIVSPFRSQKYSDNVVNISKAVLSGSQKELLHYGINFIPTYITDQHIQSKKDSILKFYTSIKNNYNPWLDINIFTAQTIHELSENKFKNNNITKTQLQSLKELKNTDTLVISKCDKGNTILVLDKNDYITVNLLHLQNTKYYEEALTYPQETIIDICNRKLNDAHKDKAINNYEHRTLLLLGTFTRRRFYSLLKLHKPKHKWLLNEKIPPTRPIVSITNSETHTISKFISTGLNALLTTDTNSLKSTEHFMYNINQLPNILPNNVILFTADVENLFMNINNTVILEILRSVLHITSNKKHKLLYELLQICMNNNYFMYNEKVFKQIFGTPMGANYSPILANLYMEHFESMFFKKNPIFLDKLLIFNRYVDDIFGIFKGNIYEFKDFIFKLNTTDPQIKLTFQYSYSNIQFLNVNVFLHNSTICTAPFIKSTSSQSLVHSKSGHANHIKINCIRNMIATYFKLSSYKSHFKKACWQMFETLQEQGYNHNMLKKLEYEILKHNAPQQVCTTDEIRLGFHNCGKCNICKHGIIGSTYKIKHKFFLASAYSNCTTKNCVYAIKCTKCNLYYIGQTETPIKVRMQNHLSTIRTRKDIHIANHFNTGDHNVLDDFRFTILKSNFRNNNVRIEYENSLIDELYTMAPHGLNDKIIDTHKSFFSIPYICRESKTVNSFKNSTNFVYKHDFNFARLFHKTKF